MTLSIFFKVLKDHLSVILLSLNSYLPSSFAAMYVSMVISPNFRCPSNTLDSVINCSPEFCKEIPKCNTNL